jgi:hypothetical protein
MGLVSWMVGGNALTQWHILGFLTFHSDYV